MNKILEKMYYDYVCEPLDSNCTKEIDKRLEKNKKNLKLNLNKNEKKLLLRIIDDKDLASEEKSLDSFICGFKIGIKIGYESNKD